MGDIMKHWGGGDENTEIGECQGKEVNKHDSLEIGSGQNDEIEDVSDDADENDDVGNNIVCNKVDPLDVGIPSQANIFKMCYVIIVIT